MLLACTNVTWVKNCTTLLYTQKAEEQLIRNNKLNWWENSSLPWSRQGRSKYLLALMTGFHKILLVPVLFLNSQYRTLHGSLNSWTLKLGLYCSFPQPTKTLHEEINMTIRKEIYVLFHSNYSLFWQTSYFQQVKFTLALWTPSLSHPTIPSLNSCTYEELLCKDNILRKNVFSLFPFLPYITGLLSHNQWGKGYFCFCFCFSLK